MLFLSKYHIIHKISSFLSHDRLSEANLFFFFQFLPYTFLLSNTYKTHSKAAVRYLRLNTENEIEYKKENILP